MGLARAALLSQKQEVEEAESQGRTDEVSHSELPTPGQLGGPRRGTGRAQGSLPHHVGLGNSTPQASLLWTDHRPFQFPQSLLRGGGDFLPAQLLS